MPSPRDTTPQTAHGAPTGTGYVLGCVALGAGTAAYLALVALAPDGVVRGTGLLPTALTALPLAVALVVSWRVDCARDPGATRATARFGRGVAPAYLGGLVLGVLLDALVLDRGTWPAALVALLPALPCWLEAGRARRTADLR